MSNLGQKTTKNAIAVVAEQIIVGLSLFLFYGYLARVSNLKDLGILSLVLTISAIAQTSNIGLGSSLLRYIPQMEGRRDRLSSVSYLQTAVLLTTVFFILFLLIVYFPFRLFVLKSVGSEASALVNSLYLPCMLYVVLLNISIVTQSALAAFQLSHYRVYISAISASASLILVVFAFPALGLAAAAWALVLQSVLTLILGWAALKREVVELPIIPLSIDRTKAKELALLGGKVQLLSLCLLAGEPFTRLMIGVFGTIEQVALFAFAWRIVIQVRGLVYSASSALVPALGYSGTNDTDMRDRIYFRFNSCIGLIAIPSMLGVVAVAPHFGELWLQTDDSGFSIIVLITALGLLPSTLTLGTFQYAISAGYMRANLASHFAMVIGNLTMGPLFAYFGGGIGAAAALATSMALLGLVGFLGNSRSLALKKHGFRLRDDLFLGFAACVAIAAIWLGLPEALWPGNAQHLIWFALSVFLFVAVVCIVSWSHSACKELLTQFFQRENAS